MKRFLLICFILIAAGSLVAQTPTVANLTTTSGAAIKWYSAATGGTLYTGTEALVNGQHYYASQTVNGVESTERLDVIATVTSCASVPSLTTEAVTNIGSTTANFNGNITALNGANVTTRGFKYSTTNGFNPLSTGTNISETGTFTSGTFSLSPSGFTSTSTYYVVAYATNSAGTNYGTQVTFTTTVYTQWTFTNAGASGKTGPTQTQVNTAYSGTSLAGAVTITIQGIQEWTVPTTGTYRIEAIGAAGGADNGGTAGKGARMIGDFSLSQGDVLKIVSGQLGLRDADAIPNHFSAGGGGGSFVINASNSPYVIAGGGGGSNGLPQSGNDASANTSGLNGYSVSIPANYGIGGTSGYGATNSSSIDGGPCSGNGGGLLGDGANTTCYSGTYGYGYNNAALGGNSSYGFGGFGGGGGGGDQGAGGGGGYSGGGGNWHFPGNGGGAGSYNSGANQSNTAGFNNGDGQVIITKL